MIFSTPETLAETPEVKQVGVEVELLKDSHSDIVADTQETPETHAVGEEPDLPLKHRRRYHFTRRLVEDGGVF